MWQHLKTYSCCYIFKFFISFWMLIKLTIFLSFGQDCPISYISCQYLFIFYQILKTTYYTRTYKPIIKSGTEAWNDVMPKTMTAVIVAGNRLDFFSNLFYFYFSLYLIKIFFLNILQLNHFFIRVKCSLLIGYDIFIKYMKNFPAERKQNTCLMPKSCS